MAVPLGVVDALAEWSGKESGGLQEKWPDMLRVMEVHLCSVCRFVDIFTIFFPILSGSGTGSGIFRKRNQPCH